MCMFGITYTENIYEIWNTLLTHTDFNIFRAHWMLCTHKSTLHCAQISTWSTQWDIIVQDKDGHSALDRINFHTVTVGSTRTQLKMIWLSPLLLLTDVENFKNLSFIEKPILYMLNDIFHLCAIFLASLGSVASIREACPEQWVDASVSSYNSRLCWYKISQHHYWQWLQIRRITLGNSHTLDFSVCVHRHNNHHHYNHWNQQQAHHN